MTGHPDDARDDGSARRALDSFDVLLDELPVRPVPLEVTSPPRSRRRATVVLAAAAAVLLVAGLGVGLVRTFGPGDDDPPEPAGPGGRWQVVGIGAVTVEVPSSWAVDGYGCGEGYEDVVYFEANVYVRGAFCGGEPDDEAQSEQSSLSLGDDRPDTRLRRSGVVGGHRLLTSPVRCQPISGRSCQQVVGVPDLDAWVYISVRRSDGGRALLDHVRESLAVLPDGRTSVPAPRLRDESRDDYVLRLREAGFRVDDEALECDANADCYGYEVAPRPGTVVDVGATLEVTGY